MDEPFFVLKPFHKNVGDSEILQDLLRVSKTLNRNTITYREYIENGTYSTRLLETRFGTFGKALQAAGLTPGRLVNLSAQELFDNLEEVWIKLGRQPSRDDMHPPLSPFAYGRYARRFGSWRKALEAFVEYIRQEERALISEPNEVAEPSPPRAPGLRLRFLVMKRDHFKCQYCGKSPATDPGIQLQVDHIVPWSKGGRTELANLVTSCSACNLGKGDISPE